MSTPSLPPHGTSALSAQGSILRSESPPLDGDAPSLLARIRLGDEHAFREVMAAHAGSVHGAIRRIVRDPGLAQEAVQDTFVALWKRPDAYDPTRGSLRAYLLGVARFKAIDALRANRRVPEPLEPEDRAFDPLEELEPRTDMWRALAVLSMRQREAFYLAYFVGLTYKEVAEHLGIPEGTAKSRLRDGLIKLRATLLASPAA